MRCLGWRKLYTGIAARGSWATREGSSWGGGRAVVPTSSCQLVSSIDRAETQDFFTARASTANPVQPLQISSTKLSIKTLASGTLSNDTKNRFSWTDSN